MGNINCYVKIYIKCDYSEKEEAKALGCYFDSDEKLWCYCFKEDTGTDYGEIRKYEAYELINKRIFSRFEVVKVKSYSDERDKNGKVIQKGFATVYYEKVCERIFKYRNLKDEKLVRQICTFSIDWGRINEGLELIKIIDREYRFKKA